MVQFEDPHKTPIVKDRTHDIAPNAMESSGIKSRVHWRELIEWGVPLPGQKSGSESESECSGILSGWLSIAPHPIPILLHIYILYNVYI